MAIYIEVDGKSITLAQLARDKGVNYGTLWSRWEKGARGLEDLIKKPKEKATVYVGGRAVSLSSICQEKGASYDLARMRWGRGERDISKLLEGRRTRDPVRVDMGNKTVTLREASYITGISKQTIWARIKNGATKYSEIFKPVGKRPSKKSCNQCGETFIPHRNSAKYCSRKCLALSQRNNTLSQCLSCGEDFTPRKDTGNGREQVYCSRMCAFDDIKAWSGGLPHSKLPEYSMVKPCEICGRLHGNTRRLCCSRECDMERARQRYYANKPKPDPRECKECRQLFSPLTSSGAKFCSNECSTRNGRRVYKAKRRARKRGLNYENVNPFKVFDRDGWRCQLCGTLTPRKHRGSMKRNAPELDHRIPLARGGDHSYANTQCLCRACNSAKGDRTEAGQYALLDVVAQGRGAVEV